MSYDLRAVSAEVAASRSPIPDPDQLIPEIRIYNVALPHAEIDLSLIVVGLERLSDPDAFLAHVRAGADDLGVQTEIIALPGAHSEYGAALRAGFRQARGAYIITVDPDVAGPLTLISDLWSHRCAGEIVIASRY